MIKTKFTEFAVVLVTIIVSLGLVKIVSKCVHMYMPEHLVAPTFLAIIGMLALFLLAQLILELLPEQGKGIIQAAAIALCVTLLFSEPILEGLKTFTDTYLQLAITIGIVVGVIYVALLIFLFILYKHNNK